MKAKHSSDYGERNLEKDLQSYKIGINYNVRGKNVIVLDDITTSGYTFMAAHKFLTELGAKKVVCIAFGKTQGYE